MAKIAKRKNGKPSEMRAVSIKLKNEDFNKLILRAKKNDRNVSGEVRSILKAVLAQV